MLFFPTAVGDREAQDSVRGQSGVGENRRRADHFASVNAVHVGVYSVQPGEGDAALVGEGVVSKLVEVQAVFQMGFPIVRLSGVVPD